MIAPQTRESLAYYMLRSYMQSDKSFDIATCMWYTGIDPMSGKEVTIARQMRDRKLQRALMQFFKPENWFEVREALLDNGRADLIGNGCDCLVPTQPPREAIEARRNKSNAALRNDYYHSMGNPGQGEEAGERTQPPLATNRGYRPHRKTQQRRRK
jgi:Domain of unknown function (DUF3362)